MINEVILTLTDFDGNASTIDLYENEKVHLNYKFTDLTNFSSVGNYSQEFRIPASKKNVDFFGAIFNVNFSGWFDFRKKVEAVLTVNTIPIAHGHAQVKKLYWQKGKLFEFEIVFFGEVPNLGRKLNEKKIRDLKRIKGGELDYDLLHEYIESPPNEHTILTLCDKWNLTATNPGSLAIYPGSSSNALKTGHLTPAVSAYYLFSQIMEDAAVQWVSDNLSDMMNHIYVPFVNGQYLNNSIGLNDNASLLALASDVTSLTFTPGSNIYNLYGAFTEYTDVGNNWSGGVFTVPYSAQYSFRIAINGVVTTLDGQDFGTYPLRVIVYVDDSYVYSYELSQSGYIFHLNTTQTYSLDEGQEVKFKMQIYPQNSTTGSFDWEVDLYGNAGVNSFGTGVELVSVSTSLVGDTVVMEYNAPDMKQIDFLTSIQKMFNLAFVPDKTLPNTLRIEPLAKYIGTGNTLDWTNKLDLSKDITYYPTVDLQKATFTFKYTEDGDYYNSLYKDNGHVFGTYAVTENDFEILNEFATGEEKVELSFSPTPCQSVDQTNVVVPKFLNSEGQFVQPKPRILYHANDSTILVWNEASSGSVNTNVPCLSNYSSTNPDANDFDLNFAPEIPLHPIIASPYNNLYNLYWRNYYRELYDGQARIMEGMFALTLSDIFSIQWSDKIWIVDSWWRILDIEGYVVGGQDVTKVKLIRLLDVANDCNLYPVSSNLDQTLNWETLAGDPTSINEECCRRFGYYWNPTKSNCYSIPNNGTRSFITAQAPTLPPTEFNAPVSFTAAISQPIKTIDVDYVVTNFDRVLISDVSAGNINIYLPPAEMIMGREIVIQNKTGINTVIINPYSGEYINGSLSLWLTTAGQTVTLISDGTNFISTTAK